MVTFCTVAIAKQHGICSLETLSIMLALEVGRFPDEIIDYLT